MVDAIVVGSGPVGAVAARRLAEAGYTVTMLERGGPISTPSGSHVRNDDRFQRDPDSYLAGIAPHVTYFDTSVPPAGLPGASFTAAVGGQGVLWTNNCPRATVGLELDETLEPAEWDRYYDIAEAHLGVRSDLFARSVRQQRIRAVLDEPLAAQARHIVDQPMAGRVAADGAIHYNATSDILEFDHADRIEVRRAAVSAIEHTSGRAQGVVLDGGERLAAPLVVVAAGAFGAPLLLHRSAIRPPALGHYLTYHAVVVAQVVLSDGLFDASDARDLPPRLMIPPTGSHPWHTMILRDINPFSVSAPDESIPENRLVEVQAFCPMDILESNTMHTGGDGTITFDVPLTDDDRARMDAVMGDVADLQRRLGRFRAGCEPQWMDLGFAHVMGTCRMGRDPATSVVDPEGRPWGIDGLHVVGTGVISTRLAVNPTLTAAALAIRSVDHALAVPPAEGSSTVR